MLVHVVNFHYRLVHLKIVLKGKIARRGAVLVIGMGLIGLFLVPAGDRSVHGRASVVDGDTLIVNGKTLRLVGIDAPELEQICTHGSQEIQCGQVARETLKALVKNSPVRCHLRGRDQYQRLLAECRVEAWNVNRRLVALGWALSISGYDTAQQSASRQGSGLWSMEFLPPAAWRRRETAQPGRGG